MALKSPSIAEITSQYKSVRQHTLDLASPLSPEDVSQQPVVFVSPPKWHLAHTTWFFEEFVLSKFDPSYERFDEDFAFLFNSYYNFVGKRVKRESRGTINRPFLEEVLQYRAYVDQHMIHFMESDLSDDVLDVIQIGLNHEQQHQELFLTDTKFIFHQNPLAPSYKEGFDLVSSSNSPSGEGHWIDIPEGLYDIGFEGSDFSFDNEHGRHKQYVHAYSIADQLVTNGEYLEFIADGGYNRHEFWHDEGWAWLKENDVQHPLYWKRLDEWKQFTLAGDKPLQKDAFVAHVSFYEASAFAAWKGCRLPTEFEWEVASNFFNWGLRWEWTNSAYLPYPGYQKKPGAIGEYNGKFMINQMVLRGASVATPENHSRKTYRNFFHPDLSWQFTGIRLAK